MNSFQGPNECSSQDDETSVIYIREPWNSVPANVSNILELENVNLSP